MTQTLSPIDHLSEIERRPIDRDGHGRRVCPACSSRRFTYDQKTSIFTCSRCEAIFGEMTLGESYALVLPFMIVEPLPVSEYAERVRYYDFTCIGSNGITRRHGWFDLRTKRIVQIG